MGLGRALCCAAMDRFAQRNGFPVYIHTQPWSWKAVFLYLSLGCRIQKTDTFSRYRNEYEQAMTTLKRIVTAEKYQVLLAASED